MLDAVITGVGLWTPGYADARAWRDRAPDPECVAPEARALDRRNRRRASTITRALADVFGQAVEQSGADSAEVGAVFGSALGEAGAMIKLLDQIWREGGELSPMTFAGSVHNAASGLVSISSKNHGFTTSLAADYDTSAMALLEGLGFLATHSQPVIVVCGDEQSPADLVPAGEEFALLAGAVALGPAPGNGRALARVRGPIRGDPTVGAADAPPLLARNPQAGLLDLIDAILHRRSGAVRLDRGRGEGWCLEVVAL